MIALLAALLVATPAELIVGAASSLKEALGAVARRFEEEHPGVRVRLDLAGSQELRTQIEHGAPADVFASADLRHAEALHQQGLASTPVVFARNELALIVPRGNPGRIRALSDLPGAARVVLAASQVPAGAYAERLLENAGGAELRRRVLARVVSRELNVRQVLTKVALGEADAGIVYRTDAAPSDRIETVGIPPGVNVIAEYPIVVVSASRQPDLAGRFVQFTLSAPAQALLRAAGFLPP